MVCLNAMNTLWCRKASILPVAMWSFEQGRWTTKRAVFIGRLWKMWIHMWKWRPRKPSRSTNQWPPKSSSGQLTCYCCGMEGHMKSECYKREKAECTSCEQKGHLVQACMKKAPGTKRGSLASSLKSDRASSEATEQDLVVYSGSTDHTVVNKNWFKNIKNWYNSYQPRWW